MYIVKYNVVRGTRIFVLIVIAAEFLITYDTSTAVSQFRPGRCSITHLG